MSAFFLSQEFLAIAVNYDPLRPSNQRQFSVKYLFGEAKIA